MQCVATSAVGAIVLTPENEQTLQSAIQNYENTCAQAGSPVTINLSSILQAATSAAATGTSNRTGTNTGTGAFPSNTSTDGAGKARELGLAGLAGLIGLVAFSLSA